DGASTRREDDTYSYCQTLNSHKAFIQGVRKKVSNILRGGSTLRNKKKKSHKPWSRNAYFLSYVHLFSDSRRLGALEDNSLCHHS
ncbi:hypothetical protein C0J52_19678, partial [Blattella germanica]